MNRKNLSENLSMLMTGIIFVGIGFAAGYAVSDFFMEDAFPPAEAVSTVETPPPTPVYTPAPVDEEEMPYYGVYYLIRAEKDELFLYEADGADKKILRKSKINMNSFPSSDVQELKNGINTGTLEGALEIWESFVE